MALVAVITGLASCGSAPENLIPHYQDPGLTIPVEPK